MKLMDINYNLSTGFQESVVCGFIVLGFRTNKHHILNVVYHSRKIYERLIGVQFDAVLNCAKYR